MAHNLLVDDDQDDGACLVALFSCMNHRSGKTRWSQPTPTDGKRLPSHKTEHQSNQLASIASSHAAINQTNPSIATVVVVGCGCVHGRSVNNKSHGAQFIGEPSPTAPTTSSLRAHDSSTRLCFRQVFGTVNVARNHFHHGFTNVPSDDGSSRDTLWHFAGETQG